MRATEWAGWIVVAAFVVLVITVLGAGWYVGQQLVDGIRVVLP